MQFILLQFHEYLVDGLHHVDVYAVLEAVPSFHLDLLLGDGYSALYGVVVRAVAAVQDQLDLEFVGLILHVF